VRDLSGADPESLREVRGWTRQVLPELGGDHLADVMMVAVELVTNALDHGDGPRSIRLTRSSRPCVVEVEVEDSNTAPLTRGVSRFGEARHRGRGLVMIANVSQEWGVRCDEAAARKTVWAEVDCTDSPCPPPPAGPAGSATSQDAGTPV
jgi:anti-sigma regulatory factor (Ser/Thr protein kinase)